MIVADGPGAPWYPAGACGFTVQRLNEAADAEVGFVLIGLSEDSPDGNAPAPA